MINISRYTIVQGNIKFLVNEFVENLKTAINNYASLPKQEALKNSIITFIHDVWEKEYGGLEFSWSEVQLRLNDAIMSIEVIEVNSSPAAEPLDYDSRNYPKGRNVIAIGGLGLSRGLTLEGLTVSYFLRNSIMYDTLMQMGRWFGYRDGFSDLCRIYMTEDASSWYAHISNVLIELRGEFHRMKMAKMTPRDFGLCVRCHPESLIVTARNKMRSGIKVCRKISLAGRNVESSTLLNTSEAFSNNRRCLDEIINFAEIEGQRIKGRPSIKGHFWEKVPMAGVYDFIDNFINHPACMKMEKAPLLDYIERLSRRGEGLWDLALISLKSNRASYRNVSVSDSIVVVPEERTNFTERNTEIFFNNRKVSAGGDERTGLTEKQLEGLDGRKVSDRDYREIRKKPLIMLHMVDFKKDKKFLFDFPVVAYGLSFPGQEGDTAPEELVEYQVNTTWWKYEYSDLLEDTEEVDYEM
jgi:hypothetical protein